MPEQYPAVPGVEFRDIPGFSGYCVGNDGSVWSCRVNGYRHLRGKWKKLKPHVNRDGYHRVNLQYPIQTRECLPYSKEMRACLVHSLVLTAFVGPCPPGMQACHFPDRNPANNNTGNLRWATPVENARDKRIHGTQIQGSKSHAAKLSEADVTEMRARIDQGESIRDTALRFRIHPGRLSHILAGRTWRHVGAADLTPKKRYAHKVTSEDVEEMRRLAAEGMSQKVIGQRFGIHASQVCRRIRGFK